MALSSSNLGLPNDWAVVSSSESPEQVNESETNNELPSSSIDPVLKDAENNSQVGSQVQNVVEESDFAQHDSTSSSDIDIIDESALDDSPEKRTFIRPSLSISSISESSSASPESPAQETGSQNADEETRTRTENEGEETRTGTQNEDSRINWPNWIDLAMNVFDRLTRAYDEMAIDRNRVKFALSFIILITTYNIARNPASPIKPKTNVPDELQELIKQLQSENKNLKNQVLLEMQNDKIFSSLEEQMKDLKKENRKLQEIILSLQKQSAAESNGKKETQNFYKKEINYLKEQINVLQFDNEELQNQLVRMRYGSYVPNSDAGKEEMEKDENSSEILSNEIKELRKDLQNEISKLRKLNDLIETLTKDLHRSENKAGAKEPLDGETHKDEKKSFWGWKDMRNNIKDAVHNFQRINIPGLFSKYVSQSKTSLEDTFKNIGHFFKATQKDINAHKEYLKELWDKDFKSTLKELAARWAKIGVHITDDDLKNVEENENNKPEFFTKSDPGKAKHNGDGHKSNYNKKHEKKGVGNEAKETMKDDLASESWVFDRAAERAKSREEEEEINWFLRPRRDENDEESQIEAEEVKGKPWF